MINEWSTKDFKDCIVGVKNTPKILKKKFMDDGNYPIISQERDLINGYWSNSKDVFSVERPVVIFGDHTKVLKYIDFDFVIGADGVRILQAKPFLHPKYFYYFLFAFPVKTLGYARHFKLLKEIKISYPPLPEQKRIVAILDEAFAGIIKAVANAEKNLANARELFESYTNTVFKKKGAEWKLKSLGNVCENLDSKRIPITKAKRTSGDIPYYGASGVVDYVAEYIFNEDLLLVSEDGANILARTYPIAFSISGKSWVNNHAHVLRFKEITSQRFVEYYLNSISLEPYVSGMAQPKLNQKSLNLIPVPFSNLTEQELIVNNLDEISTETRRLGKIYKKKLTVLAELKQSILQKAFTGELTADTVKKLVN